MHAAGTSVKYRMAIETRAKRHFRQRERHCIVVLLTAQDEPHSQETTMPTNKTRGLAAIAFIAATAFAGTAQAGECPAGQFKPNAREAVNHAVQGVTDTTLGAIDLGKEQAKITGRE